MWLATKIHLRKPPSISWKQFCWLCLAPLDPADPYSHYRPGSRAPCTGQLFHGIDRPAADEVGEGDDDGDGGGDLDDWEGALIFGDVAEAFAIDWGEGGGLLH